MKFNPFSIIPKKLNPLRQTKKKKSYSRKVGLAPGQLLYIGEHEGGPIEMSLIKYDQSGVEEYDIKDVEDLIEKFDPGKINWINIDGINDVEMIGKIAGRFSFHPLMTEDILNTEHLPKSEEYDDHHFFTLKMLRLGTHKREDGIYQEHVSFVLGNNYVISFQDNISGDVFDNVRLRIKTSRSRLRRNGSDYLFYALLDSVVDGYFNITEFVRDKIGDMEDYILENPAEQMSSNIIAMRKQLNNMRKVILPLRDAVDRLFTDESEFIQEHTYTYFRDVQDHIVHIYTTFDGFKETVSSMMDMHMSNLSNSLNMIMRTLTIFSLFFVPLTFIAGVYGMNFQYMPELAWKYGYPFALGLMFCCVLVMFIYMRRKGWL